MARGKKYVINPYEYHTNMFLLIEKSINQAIELFIERDIYLLNIGGENHGFSKKLHEVCISHQLASYIEKFLRDNEVIDDSFYVDIEYNKNLQITKSNNGSNIRPDIIVHKRGINDHNLIVIELKKNNYLGRNHINLKNDIKKIRDLCDVNGIYKYKYGFMLIANDANINIHEIFNIENT